MCIIYIYIYYIYVNVILWYSYKLYYLYAISSYIIKLPGQHTQPSPLETLPERGTWLLPMWLQSSLFRWNFSLSAVSFHVLRFDFRVPTCYLFPKLQLLNDGRCPDTPCKDFIQDPQREGTRIKALQQGLVKYKSLLCDMSFVCYSQGRDCCRSCRIQTSIRWSRTKGTHIYGFPAMLAAEIRQLHIHRSTNLCTVRLTPDYCKV